MARKVGAADASRGHAKMFGHFALEEATSKHPLLAGRRPPLTLPITLSIVGIPLGASHVRRIRFRHELSRPWRLVVEIASTDPDVDLDRAIGASVQVDLEGEAFVPTVVGIVEDARQTAVEVTGESTYLFEIAPSVSLLSHRRSQRIFQHQDVVATFAQLLGEHTLAPIETRLREPHVDREYTVQWNESDLDLARRLLAEDGLTLVTDPGLDLVRVTDDTPSGTEVLAPILGFRPDAQALRDPDEPPSVRSVTIGRRIEAGHLNARDYDFERPEYIPEAHARHPPTPSTAIVEGRLDVYEYQVGAFDDEAGAQLEARRRFQELRRDVRTLRVTTNTMIPAGVRIGIAGHPRRDVDGELLVIASETEWHQGGRSDEVVCIPAVVAFRPQRLAKPRVHGAQTAFVVTPDGEEIDVDEHGRVMVEFRWDRRDLHSMGSSRRVRVSQPWAGPGFGMTMLPRRNEEVIVTYLDGDPDEPIIAGRVHNGWSRDPLQLPAEKTQSIWKSRSVPSPEDGSAYNMIRMEDAAGAEMLELRAQRDFRQETLRNSETIVGVDESKKVGGSSSTTVAGASTLQSGSASIHTGAFQVTSTTTSIESTGNMTLTAGGARRDTSANHNIATGGLWVNASEVTQIVSPLVKVMANEIVLQGGGSTITINGSGVFIKGPIVDVKGGVILLNC